MFKTKAEALQEGSKLAIAELKNEVVKFEQKDVSSNPWAKRVFPKFNIKQSVAVEKVIH